MGGAAARTRASVLAAGLLVAGCASSAEVAGIATQQDVFQIRADVTAVQRSLQQTQAKVDNLAAHTARPAPQAADQGQTAALAARVDALTTTVNRLATRLDDLSTRVETLNRQLRASPAPGQRAPAQPGTAVPERPAPKSAAVSPAPATPSPAPVAPPAAVPSSPAGARPATGAARPQDVYQAAYIDFSKGSYSLAISAFREFLRRYPDHQLAGNAQYWVGESYVGLARGYGNAGQTEQVTQALQQAVLEFRKVLANYPRGETAPTALYKEALALIDLKQPALAQQRLEYLIGNFPQAAEAPLAKERLATLKER